MAARKINASLVVPTLLVLTGLGPLLFRISSGQSNPRESFLARQCAAWYPWERSFVIADGWIRGRRWGRYRAAMAGSAMPFLALMDLLFFLQNGLYCYAHPKVLTEALIHAWHWGLGWLLVMHTNERDPLRT